MIKKYFSLLMTFVIAIGLIFPFPNLTDAHKGTEEFHDCECGNKEVVEKPEGFEILEENKVRQAYSSLHNESEFKKAIKWLKDEGLKINPKTGAGIEMDSLILKINGRKFQQVDHYAWRADSKDNKNIGILVVVLDKKTKEVLHLKADIFYNINGDRYSHVQSYIMGEGLTEKIPFEVANQINSPKSNTVTIQNVFFDPCVHASIWVCLYHCGIWAAATGSVGGAVCSVICGYAFAYACS